MYDRNKGVQSIIDAQYNGDKDELLPKGAIFNQKTGKISHNVFEDFKTDLDWRWLIPLYYPVYDNAGNYLGYTDCGKFKEV